MTGRHPAERGDESRSPTMLLLLTRAELLLLLLRYELLAAAW